MSMRRSLLYISASRRSSLNRSRESTARILINAGILPCTFKNEADYDLIDEGDLLSLSGLKDAVESGSLDLLDKTKGITVPLSLDLSDRAKDIITAGGLLNFTKENF